MIGLSRPSAGTVQCLFHRIMRERRRWMRSSQCNRLSIPLEQDVRQAGLSTILALATAFPVLRQEFPVRFQWEFSSDLLKSLRFWLRILSRETRVESIPCKFPANQGIVARDGFAADCLHRQTLS